MRKSVSNSIGKPVSIKRDSMNMSDIFPSQKKSIDEIQQSSKQRSMSFKNELKPSDVKSRTGFTLKEVLGSNDGSFKKDSKQKSFFGLF